MNLPFEIAQIVTQLQSQTQQTPGLALSHALLLDNKLTKLDWLSPITYSATGIACPECFSKNSPVISPALPQMALFNADAKRKQSAPTAAVEIAFQTARDAEIPALNLLYANQCLPVETLWLHFFNKYLAYFGSTEGGIQKYSVKLTSGIGNQFNRLSALHIPQPVTTGPLISVLMPIYNAATTLEKAANSILTQSWQNIELLLIDDCSQDNSLAIAHQLADQDCRVKVMSTRINGGPYIAKNLAVSQAKGEYITVHDADDWAFPSRLADQMVPLLASPTGPLKATMGKTLRMNNQGSFTRFQPTNWVTNDGAMRWCFPSPLFERRYFVERLGAWDSVNVGADTEIIQRIRRFEPRALEILDIPVMLQLDAEDSLTRAETTYNDDRGESPVRVEYRQSWSRWHAKQPNLPKLLFPLAERPFPAPSSLQKHILNFSLPDA
jgi:hypothetical protein